MHITLRMPRESVSSTSLPSARKPLETRPFGKLDYSPVRLSKVQEDHRTESLEIPSNPNFNFGKIKIFPNPRTASPTPDHLSPIQAKFRKEARNREDSSGTLGRSLVPYSSGSPLPVKLRANLEQALKSNLSGVRLHTGEYVRAFDADAFTQGQSIHFAPGEYKPDTPEGKRLLVHELTHTIQQQKRHIPGAVNSLVNRDPALEGEADKVAEQVAEKGAAHIISENSSRSAPAIGAPVQLGKSGQRYKNRRSRHKEQWAADKYVNRDEENEDEPEPSLDEAPRGYQDDSARAPASARASYVEPDTGPRTGLIGWPQKTGQKILGNVMRGEPPMRPELGRHGKVTWATVTHHDQEELPSRPYSGRDNPSNALASVTYEMEQSDRHIAEADVKRVYRHFEEKATGHAHRLNRSSRTAEAAPTPSNRQIAPLVDNSDLDYQPSLESVPDQPEPALDEVGEQEPAILGDQEIEYPSDAETDDLVDEEDQEIEYPSDAETDDLADEILPVGPNGGRMGKGRVPKINQDRHRKVQKRGQKRQTRKQIDRTPRIEHPEVIERQAGVRTWKTLGGHGEGGAGLTSMSIPGNHPLSRPSGEFVVMPQEARDRMRIEGQERYTGPHSRRPQHPVSDNSDMERFVQSLEPGSYEQVNSTAEEEAEEDLELQHGRKERQAPRNQTRGRRPKR